MKKILNKIFRKQEETLPNRITTETVAEHREKILAGGRRFKYPVQYAKHKLVINATLISLAALVIIIVAGWYVLYVAQGSSTFVYSITKVLPVPVANADGQVVNYRDYLMEYRGYIYYYENKEQLNIDSEDGQRQLAYLKKQALDGAIADAYAKRLATEMNVSVSDEELEVFLASQRKLGNIEISEQTYDTSTLKYFGWTPNEYRNLLKNRLLRQKVSYALDDSASSVINSVFEKLEADLTLDFMNLVDSSEAVGDAKSTYGKSGWVPKTNQDGGLAQTASSLSKNQVSSIVQSTNGDGYYIVKLLDLSSDQVSYEYVKVALTVFDKLLQSIKDQNKIDEYIEVN